MEIHYSSTKKIQETFFVVVRPNDVADMIKILVSNSNDVNPKWENANQQKIILLYSSVKEITSIFQSVQNGTSCFIEHLSAI